MSYRAQALAPGPRPKFRCRRRYPRNHLIGPIRPCIRDMCRVHQAKESGSPLIPTTPITPFHWPSSPVRIQSYSMLRSHFMKMSCTTMVPHISWSALYVIETPSYVVLVAHFCIGSGSCLPAFSFCSALRSELMACCSAHMILVYITPSPHRRPS